VFTEKRNVARWLASAGTSPRGYLRARGTGRGERQDGDEHNGEMQRDYSPSCARASKTEAESGKEIQPKGKTCPFFRDLKEEDGWKRTQKSGEDTHEHENNETQGKRDEESDCSSPGSRRTSEPLSAERGAAGWPANWLNVGEQWAACEGAEGALC